MAGKQYEMAFQIGAKLQGQFSSSFNNARTSVTSLQTAIEALNKRQGDIAAYQKQQTAVEATRARLELLKKQYANLSAEMEKNGTASAAEQNQMLQREMQINKTTAALETQEAKLDTMGQALQRSGVNTGELTAESSRLSSELNDLRSQQEQAAQSAQNMGNALGDAADAALELGAAVGVTKVLQESYQLMERCAKSSIEFESSMAAVKRTVGGSDSFLSAMGEDFKQLSTDIPITTSELAQIAMTAGQLGIAQDRVEGFTTVMAMLATTTDLTADTAATMLAQYANITGVTDYERMGSVVAELGDATATTASKVVEMSQGMAASASQAGMSAVDIMAIAASVGSLGIEAQAGSTAMSTLISTLYKATETGEKLDEFASVAGMSAVQFKQAWQDDAVGAMNAFIQGLNDTERNGRSAIVILDELGITNVRQTKAILGLASAGDLLSNTIVQANNAWNENTALSNKASVMYETTEAKLTMAGNAANNLGIAIGDALTPAVGAGAEVFTSMLEPVTQFISDHPSLVRAVTAGVGVFGVATVAITGYTAITKAATAANKLFAASIPGLNIILGVTAGIAGLTAVAIGLSGAFADNSQSIEELDAEFDDLNEQIEKQQNIEDLCEEYRTLSEEIEAFKSGNKAEFNIDATLEKHGFSSMDDVKVIQELANNIQTKRGELEQVLTLAGADDIDDSDIDKVIDFGAAVTTDDGELRQQLELLGIDDIGDEDLDLIRELAQAITTDQGQLSQSLELHGFENYDDMVKACNLADDVEAANTATEISIKAKTEGFEDVGGFLETLKTKAANASTELDNAKTALSDMETNYRQLQACFKYANDEESKSAIQQEMEALAPVIDEQKTKVSALETTYQGYSSELSEAEIAAAYLADTEQRLADVKVALSESTGGAVSATETETDALNSQVEAAEALAKAEQARLRTQIFDNVSKQASAYADAVKTSSENMGPLLAMEDRLARSQQFLTMDADTMNSTYQEMLSSFDTMMQQPDYDPFSPETSKKVQELQDLIYIMSGYEFTDLGNYVDDGISFAETFGYIKTNASTASGQIEWMNSEIASYGEVVKAADATQATFIANLANGVKSGAMSMEEVEANLKNTFAGYENGAELVAAIMESVRDEIGLTADATDNMAGSMDNTSASATDLVGAMNPIIASMQELSEAYGEAYHAAYESMSGQFELFEAAPNVMKPAKNEVIVSVDEMIAAMESQAAYMQTYSANLKAVSEMGLSDGLIAQLSDGSVESAAYLATIVSDGETRIKELNTAFSSVEEGKSTFADTVAEMQTDFSTKMTELETTLATTVSNMDKSVEASEAGQATMEAFKSAAEDYLPAIQAAYEHVAEVAAAALKVNVSVGGSESDGGYASGTTNAKPGFHMVGENGPEIVWFNGGETVMTAAESRQFVESHSIEADPISAIQTSREGSMYTVEISPQYNITGNTSGEDVRAVLEEQTASLRELIEDTLNDLEFDRGRSVYTR